MTAEPSRAISDLLSLNPDLTERIDRTRCTETCCSIELAPIRASLYDLAEWALRYGGVIVGGTRPGVWKVVFNLARCRFEVHLDLGPVGTDPVLFADDCA